jgi:hypothetical protein
METENVQTQAVAPVAEQAPGAPIPAPTKPAVSATPATQAAEDENALPEWARKQLSDLRKEQAARRKAQQETERSAAQAAETAAIEQGKWKELYEKAKPQAERAAAMDAFVAEMLEAETANIPEKLKALIPQGDALATLRWVQQAKTAGILAAPQAPRTDAGAATGGTVQPKAGLLTDARRQEIATKYGLRVQDVPQQLGDRQ